MTNQTSNEKPLIKYLRLFFFFCAASFFPLSLISSGNQYVFKFISVPIFSINSGFLFHQMVSRHVLLQLNRICLKNAYITLIIYYLAIYGVGIGWAEMFIDEDGNVKLNQQVFLFLPIINGFIFTLLFIIKFYRLSLNSEFEAIFDVQSSGLANLQLQIKQQYDVTLERKNTIKKHLQNQIELEKVQVDNLESVQPSPDYIEKKDFQLIHSRTNSQQGVSSIFFNQPSSNIARVGIHPPINNYMKGDLKRKVSYKNLTQILKQITINQQKNIRFIKILIGLFWIFTGVILQIIFSVNIAKTFQFLLDQSKYFIYVICLSYPVLIGLIKLIPVTINLVLGIRYEWQIQFLSLFFASLPYRGLYLEFNAYELGFGIIFVKFFYKMIVYYLQFRFATQLYELKKKIKLKIKNLEKDGNDLEPVLEQQNSSRRGQNEKQKKDSIKDNNEDIQDLTPPPISVDSNIMQNEPQQPYQGFLIKNINQVNDYSDIDQNLAELKQKGQQFYQMVYKLEMIQFSDILHMVCVLIAILLNTWINSESDNIQSIQAFKKNVTGIIVIFFVELIMELIYTIMVTNLIGKTQDFCSYNFYKFMSDIHNFSKKQFLYIFASILCSYSILFIVLNN